jgi:two-component system, sensor histidine kinase LadS
MNKLTIIFSLLFLLINHLAIAQEVIIIKNTSSVINIAKQISVLEDTEGSLSIKDVLNQEYQHKFIKNNQPFLVIKDKVRSTWVRFELKNRLPEKTYLEIDETGILYFEVYIPTADKDSYQIKKFGSLLPIDTREIPTTSPLFSLENNQDTLSHCFYIHFKSQSARTVPLKVSVLKNFFLPNLDKELFWGIFLGVVCVMSLYNLFIYFIIKDKVYLYYVLHIALAGFTVLTFSGYSFKLFWADAPYLNQHIPYFLPSTSLFFLIIFSIYFLETHKYARIAHKGLLFFIFLLLVSLVLYFTNRSLIPVIVQVIALTLSLYLFALSIYIYHKGNKVARFYSIASGFFILGMIVFILKRNQFVPDIFLTTYSYQLGSMLEILFFSFALADKIKVLTLEREEAQKENLRLIEAQKETLERKVNERTAELEIANSDIVAQNEELHRQQEEVLALNETLETTLKELKSTTGRLDKSIKYANQIQQIILPQEDELDTFFDNHFIIYLPKDTVSGDFYWFKLLKKNKAIFVLADCTGHGVPGAFMSMIGNTTLYEIIEVKDITDPAEILLELHQSIRKILKQEKTKNTDGMDIAVCLFNKKEDEKEYKVTFAGAKSNVFYTKDGDIKQVDGDRINLGGTTERKREFTNHTFNLKEGDLIYFTSDGYIDQNNYERKRFGKSKFKQLLQFIYPLPIDEQENVVLSALQSHQQNEEQRDDISVVGIKL